MRTLFEFWSTTRIVPQVMGQWKDGMRLRLHQDLLQTLAPDKPEAHCTRLDWTANNLTKTIHLIDQSRKGQGKSKKEQVSKVKQIGLDFSKQEMMDQNRQEYSKLKRQLKTRTVMNIFKFPRQPNQICPKLRTENFF